MSEVQPKGNVYEKYDSQHPIERRLVQRFLQALSAALPSREPELVIEVGAGEGDIGDLVRRRYPRSPILGVDLPDVRLSREWRVRGLTGVFADAARLPFPDGTSDLVLAIELLEHVRDPDRVLRELLRISTGQLVLSVPREPIWRLGNFFRRRYLSAWGNTPGHLNHWSRRSFVRFVSDRASVQAVYSPMPWTIVVAESR